MSTTDINTVLDRQLLLQLGDRLKRLRKAQKLRTVEMARRAGIARNTLRSIEAGDPGVSMGAYLRVMSVLGVSGELALLAGEVMNPSQSTLVRNGSRRMPPSIQVRITADTTRHQLQDLQSLALHDEAVRLAKADPRLVQQAKETVEHWLASGDARSANLWREWLTILETGAWRKVLVRTFHSIQLRQASPLVTILPADVRERVLEQASALKTGIVFSNFQEDVSAVGHVRPGQ